MDSVNNQTKAHASQLLTIFEAHAKKIKILSLDCFDTILWRKTATPVDVFYDLQNKPHFQSHGLTAALREQAEINARKRKFLRHATTEVSLRDIYLSHSPILTPDELDALCEEELAAEAETCFAFLPVVQLMRAAKERGIKVIIVSNTYLQEHQLRQLLKSALPSDVFSYIDTIFCSCDAGKSKITGLFNHVMKTLNVAPDTLLHIGDNAFADLAAAQALGISAVHLNAFHEDTTQLMRMLSVAGPFIDPSLRHTRSLPSLFHGIIASDPHTKEADEKTVGYTSAGPILYAFGRYICNEIAELEQQGKQLKILFLMRDAYLPSLICETIAGKEIGKRVHISRFTAFAASFLTEADIDLYLADRIKSLNFDDMCKQLLLPKEMSALILKKLATSSHPLTTFTDFIYHPKTLETIFHASANYRKRLITHLKHEVGLQEGDTLLFIDLGYMGTAQNKLAPIFKKEMKVDVIGRYLVALRSPHWHTNRRGLLDPSSYDDKALGMMVAYIALLEQICTSPNASSVIDYDEQGQPIFSAKAIKDQQHHKLKQIQSECIRFTKDAENFFHSTHTTLNTTMLRDAAAINLCRLIYLPTKTELAFFNDFQFDFNLGTNEVVPVFDINKGTTALKRRSWLHSAREHLKNMRTNYPAEWRSTNLELALTLMAQHRFGLEMSLNDLSHRREKIQLLVIQGQNASPFLLEAIPTHDGYFSLMVPVINQSCKIAVQWGLNYKWLELESAETIPMSFLYTNREFENTKDASQHLAVDQMEDRGGGLFECLSENSLLVYEPVLQSDNTQRILRIIFRPIVPRTQA